jgi:hypothetical protein
LGTIEVEENGGEYVGVNGPITNGIQKKIKTQNPNIGQTFIDELTISSKCEVANKYEYKNVITCDTGKYQFISNEPSDNSVEVSFYGIQDGYIAKKDNDSNA